MSETFTYRAVDKDDHPTGTYTASLCDVISRGHGVGGLCLSPDGVHEWIVWLSGPRGGHAERTLVRGTSTACAGIARATRLDGRNA